AAGIASIADGTYADGVVKFIAIANDLSGDRYPNVFTATSDGTLAGTVDFGGGRLIKVIAVRDDPPPPWKPEFGF
ncbi:MAG TPA: hypothetical protein VE779_00810, partial [Candidatus Angelobacter sp.]|nr:hypothetical protein [Candidatus Angelobacter sp.]